ncbi:MAG: DUF1640 domain-containing protein [Methylococcales bacterium]|jgi:uncharacterized membrane protein YheB (UPF0754 family)
MSPVTFDTLQFVQTLTESGFDQKQAEGVAKALRNAQEESETATKRDLKELELVLKSEMQAMEYRMTIKLGAMLGGSIALMAGILKLMQHV